MRSFTHAASGSRVSTSLGTSSIVASLAASIIRSLVIHRYMYFVICIILSCYAIFFICSFILVIRVSCFCIMNECVTNAFVRTPCCRQYFFHQVSLQVLVNFKKSKRMRKCSPPHIVVTIYELGFCITC